MQDNSLRIDMQPLKTITLPQEYSFHEALNQLLAGTCLGMRPGKNLNYVELFKPAWVNERGPGSLLRWNGSDGTADIRTDQYMESWQLVVLDHRQLPALLSPAQA